MKTFLFDSPMRDKIRFPEGTHFYCQLYMYILYVDKSVIEKTCKK